MYSTAAYCPACTEVVRFTSADATVYRDRRGHLRNGPTSLGAITEDEATPPQPRPRGRRSPPRRRTSPGAFVELSQPRERD